MYNYHNLLDYPIKSVKGYKNAHLAVRPGAILLQAGPGIDLTFASRWILMHCKKCPQACLIEFSILVAASREVVSQPLHHNTCRSEKLQCTPLGKFVGTRQDRSCLTSDKILENTC